MSAYAPRFNARLFAVGGGLAAIVALTLGLSMNPSPGTDSAQPQPSAVSAEAGYGQIPLAFEPNAGRFDPAIDFTAKAQSGSVALSERGAVFSQTTELGDAGAGADPRLVSDAIAVRFPGADLSEAAATDKLPGVVNDLRGDDPSKHVTGISTYGGVTYSDVKPGVDLDFYGRGTALEYDFRLAPGVDPSLATTRIAGADDVHLNAAGDLVATVGKTRFVQNAPVSYQPATASEPRSAVESEFVLDGDRVSFALGDYDPSRALVIDPLQLAYSTYLGGEEDEEASAIAVDSEGQAYITGYTNSFDFDTVNPIETDSAGIDVFVSKLSNQGDELEYSTYLGGDGNDFAFDIAIDSGSAFITGETDSTDFNTANPFEPDPQGTDAFVSKLTPDGDALEFSTYLGGNDVDTGEGIAVDSDGSAYVTGKTDSFNFPTLSEIQGDSAGTDAFVTKFAPAGDATVYSTYLGGNLGDFGNGIAVDSAGSAYVAGLTSSDDFATVGEIEGDSTDDDAFVSKLTPAGDALDYSTYLGGNANDSAADIAVDPDGAAYITGRTESTNFDTVNEIDDDSSDTDAFVSKLVPAGSALDYSTYLGGGATDTGGAIAVNDAGRAYVTGETFSGDFPLAGALTIDTGVTGSDAFVSKLVSDGDALEYSTFLGGTDNDRGLGIAFDDAGGAYVTGATESGNFPTVDSIEGDSGNDDAFVSKLEPTAPQTRITGKPAKTVKTKKRSVRVKFRFSSNDEGSLYACSIDRKPYAQCRSPKTYKVGLGKHSLRVIATNSSGLDDRSPASYSFTVKKKRKRRG